MKNWFNSLNRFNFAIINGLFGAFGGLIAVIISHLMNDTMTTWVILGCFAGGFIGGLIYDNRKRAE